MKKYVGPEIEFITLVENGTIHCIVRVSGGTDMDDDIFDETIAGGTL